MQLQKGDKVRVISLTDVDDKSHVLRTNEEAYKFDPTLGGLIGATATVIQPTLNDYYDCVIKLDEQYRWEASPEFNDPAMLYCDLEKI